MHKVFTRRSCALCESEQMRTAIALPGFPDVGIFTEPDDEAVVRRTDQALEQCALCGHLQLANVISPEEIYEDDYAHRSSASHLSRPAADWFVDYVRDLSPGHRYRQALEVGCNDLILLERLAPLAASRAGVDPIWKDASPPGLGIEVIGDYAENVDFDRELAQAPDLVISTHNLEHIVDPVALVRRLLRSAADDALFVIEVPDVDAMIRNRRFDQIFHQHLHYFGLASMLELLRRAGGSYVGHRYNPANWGGTVAVAFRRGEPAAALPETRPPDFDALQRQYRTFRNQMRQFAERLWQVEPPLVGYGAGQMFPSLAYHLGHQASDIPVLSCIVDDNPQRAGLRYAGLSIPIVSSLPETDWQETAVVITALDAIDAIHRRLADIGPRAILIPPVGPWSSFSSTSSSTQARQGLGSRQIPPFQASTT